MNIKDDKIPVVSVSCFTYNHEKYIRDALQGFLIQKTNFPFEVLIHDDASTDRTPEIIREYEEQYPHLFKVIYQKENLYSKGKIYEITQLQRKRARGKYYAICEGDDYWIDPLKLQKQVDFLENNPEYGLVHTNFYTRRGDKKFTGTITNTRFYSGNILEKLIEFNFINNLTVCYRISLIEEIDVREIYDNHFIMGDYPLWLQMSRITKIGFIDDYTSVYRILNESASHSNNFHKKEDFLLSTLKIKNYYINKFNIDSINKSLISLDTYIVLLNQSICYGEYLKAKEYLQKIENLNAFLTVDVKNKIRIKSLFLKNKVRFKMFSLLLRIKLNKY